MKNQQSVNPYHAFRFCMITPDKGESINAMQVHHDPFVRGMWIGRAHLENRPPMAAALSEQTKLDVYLMTRASKSVRKISVEYEGIDWFPINLDATDSGVAMEWVLLKGATYSSYEDIEFENMSDELSGQLRVGPDL
jgi:hypothetical protein